MLTRQRKTFCLEYAKTGDATKSYLAAYKKIGSNGNAAAAAANLLKCDDIQQELKRIADDVAEDNNKVMQAREQQERLTAIARQQAVEETFVGGKTIKRHASIKSAIRAIELLAKMQGNFAPDKQQIDVSGGVPIVLVDDVPGGDDSA